MIQAKTPSSFPSMIVTSSFDLKWNSYFSLSLFATASKISLLCFSPSSLNPAVALTVMGVHSYRFFGTTATPISSSKLSTAC